MLLQHVTFTAAYIVTAKENNIEGGREWFFLFLDFYDCDFG